MQRRTYLSTATALLTAGIAGCSSSDEPTDDEHTPQPPADAHNPTAVATLNDGSDQNAVFPLPGWTALDLSVEVLDREATKSHPPSIQVTMTNTGEENLAWYTGHTEVFSPRRSQGGDLALHTFSDPHHATEHGCWRVADVWTAPTMRTATRIEPGESQSRTLYVWGAYTDAITSSW